MGSVWIDFDGLITIERDGWGSFSLDSLYLRDHCPCSECRHPETQQRLVDTFSIPEDIHPEDTDYRGNCLMITWSHGNHESLYNWDWLQAQRSDPLFPNEIRYFESNISDQPPIVGFQSVMSSENGVKNWVNRIRTWGFCFVDGCPPTSEDTQALIERITFIRNTHYGESRAQRVMMIS